MLTLVEVFQHSSNIGTARLGEPILLEELIASPSHSLIKQSQHAAEGKTEDAKAAYRKAWAAMDAKVEYRRVVEAKLNVLGANPGGVEAAK